jgi:hypothetical protein
MTDGHPPLLIEELSRVGRRAPIQVYLERTSPGRVQRRLLVERTVRYLHFTDVTTGAEGTYAISSHTPAEQWQDVGRHALLFQKSHSHGAERKRQ